MRSEAKRTIEKVGISQRVKGEVFAIDESERTCERMLLSLKGVKTNCRQTL
jgi:hypothetical protein